jgi:hypothetical protein
MRYGNTSGYIVADMHDAGSVDAVASYGRTFIEK